MAGTLEYPSEANAGNNSTGIIDNDYQGQSSQFVVGPGEFSPKQVQYGDGLLLVGSRPRLSEGIVVSNGGRSNVVSTNGISGVTG